MTKLIDLKNAIENLKKENEMVAKRFSEEELKKARTLNVAYRTYLSSSIKEERKMFNMMIELIGIDEWKDLCDLQQSIDLLEMLEDCFEDDGKVVLDYDDEFTGRKVFYMLFGKTLECDRVAFNMDDTKIDELFGKDEFPDYVKELFVEKKEEPAEEPTENPAMKKLWMDFQKKADSNINTKKGVWYTANGWKKGDYDRTYLTLHYEGRYCTKKAGYFDNKTGEYVVKDDETNILEF